MSTDANQNPYAAPQTRQGRQHPFDRARVVQRELPLEPPIEIDGHYVVDELVAAQRLAVSSPMPRRRWVMLYVVLSLVMTVAISRGIKTGSPVLFFTVLLTVVGLILLLGTARILGRLALRRAEKKGLFERHVRGEINSRGLFFQADPNDATPAATEPSSDIDWNACLEARVGDLAILLKAPRPDQRTGWIYRTITRSLFRSSADWERLQDYVTRRFELATKPVTEATCGRCRRVRPADELKPPTIFLRWLWPPLMLNQLFTDGRTARYCAPCRRSVSFALFFILFMLGIVVGLVLFAR